VIPAVLSEGTAVEFATGFEVPIDEFGQVIASRPGKADRIFLRTYKVQARALFLRVRNSKWQGATSVRLRVKAYSPWAKPPSWEAQAGLVIVPMPEGAQGELLFEQGRVWQNTFHWLYAVSVPYHASVRRWND
jgi:hypothetical protein